MANTRANFDPVTKVAPVTVGFWALKLLTTGIGETSSDFLASKSVALAGLVGVIGAVAVGFWQARSRSYRPAPYWSAVLAVAVLGTMLADGVHVFIGIPYAVTTAGYAIAVCVVLLAWRRVEGTVAVHDVTNRRREIFYWSTVVATFALGTAVGDFTALTLKIGYSGSIMVYLAGLGLIAAAWRMGLNPVAAFWAAYVLTRPLGASLADWIGKPTRLGGLGVGDGWVSLVGVLVLATAITFPTVNTGSSPKPTGEGGESGRSDWHRVIRPGRDSSHVP